MSQPLYAVYNKHCGHVIGVHPDRAIHEPVVEALQPATRHALRTRKATDDDIEAVIRGVRCERCTIAAGVGGAGKDGQP